MDGRVSACTPRQLAGWRGLRSARWSAMRTRCNARCAGGAHPGRAPCRCGACRQRRQRPGSRRSLRRRRPTPPRLNGQRAMARRQGRGTSCWPAGPRTARCCREPPRPARLRPHAVSHAAGAAVAARPRGRPRPLPPLAPPLTPIRRAGGWRTARRRPAQPYNISAPPSAQKRESSSCGAIRIQTFLSYDVHGKVFSPPSASYLLYTGS